MDIRILTEDDADAFWRLRLQALELVPAAFGEAPEEHRALSVETVALRLRERQNNFVFGAFARAELVGTAGFIRNHGLKRRHKGRVWGMYVAESARGHGVGRALLSALLDHVRTLAEMEEVILTVTSTQAAAKRLYRSLGFKEFGHESNALRLNGGSVDEDYMVLRL